jgi:hypothetical protein
MVTFSPIIVPIFFFFQIVFPLKVITGGLPFTKNYFLQCFFLFYPGTVALSGEYFEGKM